jgi:hypothetical protein
MTESVVRSQSSNAGVALKALMNPSLNDAIVLVSISVDGTCQSLNGRRGMKTHHSKTTRRSHLSP